MNQNLEGRLDATAKLSATIFDNIYEKLKPYVSAVTDASYTEEEKRKVCTDMNTPQYGEPRDATKVPLTWEDFAGVQSDFATGVLLSSWYEVLRSALKDYETVQLRDCLLPDNLGRAEEPWRVTLTQIGFSQEQAENLLKEFGQKEIASGVEFPLPLGGYIAARSGTGFELYRSKPQ